MQPKEISASLAKLPEELRFPAELAGRIGYDERRRRIAFRGFMSKAQFDLLSGLSADGDYQRAIEELFAQSGFAVDASMDATLGRWPKGRIAIALALALTLTAILAGTVRYLGGW
jgi:hypothetical protein